MKIVRGHRDLVEEFPTSFDLIRRPAEKPQLYLGHGVYVEMTEGELEGLENVLNAARRRLCGRSNEEAEA